MVIEIGQVAAIIKQLNKSPLYREYNDLKTQPKPMTYEIPINSIISFYLQFEFQCLECLLASLKHTLTHSFSVLLFTGMFLPVWGNHWSSRSVHEV